jgi:transcriptional regulator with XRE-family HTH domain
MEDVVAFRRFIMELRELREHKGLSLDDVSKASGIDKAQLSRLESGKKLNPTVHTLMRYARAVGEPLGWCSASNTSSSIEEMVVVRVIRRLGLSPEEAVFRLATNISAAPPTRDAPSLHGYANPQGSVVISNLSSPASQENSGAARAHKESDKR